jgi:hypothetical protein
MKVSIKLGPVENGFSHPDNAMIIFQGIARAFNALSQATVNGNSVASRVESIKAFPGRREGSTQLPPFLEIFVYEGSYHQSKTIKVTKELPINFDKEIVEKVILELVHNCFSLLVESNRSVYEVSKSFLEALKSE